MIYYMARPSVHIQLAIVIGGSSRMTREKDMEHTRQLMERDTRGNTKRIRCTGMEYSHGKMEQCIMEDTNRT